MNILPSEMTAEMLSTVLENSNIVVFSRSIDGELFYSEGNVKELFGVDNTDVQSKKNKWIDLVYEEDRKLLLQSTFDAIKSPTGSNIIEFRVKMPDGSLKWRRRVGSVHKQGDRWILKGVISDIDKEKRDEAVSKEMMGRFKDTSNQIEEGLLILSPQYKILFINEYAIRLLERKAFEFEDMGIDDIFFLDGERKLSDVMKETVSKGFKLKIGLLDNSGAFARLLKRKMPIELKLSKGNDNKVYVTFNDISDMIEYEKKLIEQTRKLEDMNKNLSSLVQNEIQIRLKHEKMVAHQSKIADMGRLISSIAHRWRQPLNGLGLNIQYIKQLYDLGELDSDELVKVYNDCIKSINSMSETIDKFASLFVSDEEIEDLNLLEQIDEIAYLYMSSLASQQIILTIGVVCDEENPVGIEEALADDRYREEFNISCHENQFLNVMLNLLSNSMDAIDERTESHRDIQGCINVCLRKEAGCISIEVSDNGVGISKDIEDHIFEPYFTTKEEGKGIGMGLYLSRHYIENSLKGRLRYDRLANGSRFAVSVPCLPAKR